MKVLAIGNSFSQDATRYLHQIAKADGVDMTVVNLYIGGCSLYTHYKNILTDAVAYSMDFNGESTGFFVSVKEALLAHNWDFITLQQVSHESNNYEAYQPYLDKLAEYVKTYCPKAKLCIHQTWAYEQGSDNLKGLGYGDHRDMLADVKNAYKQAADDINAYLTIPSGELFQKMIGAGIKKIHRDGFHATLGLGRYALGLLWYLTLTGRPVADNAFCNFDEPVLPEEVAIAKKSAESLR